MTFEVKPFVNTSGPWLSPQDDIAAFKAHLAGAEQVECGGQVVAALTTWRNPMHPFLLRFATLTTPIADTVSQSELADVLITNVVARAKQNGQRGLMAVTPDTMSPLRSAMVSRGLRRIRTTFQPQLRLQEAQTAPVTLAPGTKLLTQSDILNSEGLTEALIQTTYLAYQGRHAVDQVKPFAEKDWAPRILTNLEPTAPLALAQGETIGAYCLTYLRHGHLEFGGAWGADHGLLDGLLAYTLPALASRYETLAGAFSDTDEGGLQVYMTFPDQPEAKELGAFALLF